MRFKRTYISIKQEEINLIWRWNHKIRAKQWAKENLKGVRIFSVSLPQTWPVDEEGYSWMFQFLSNNGFAA